MSMPFDSAASSTRFDQETMTDSDSFENADAVEKHDAVQDPALNGCFYDENAHRATRYAMSIVHRWADAEEIVQEAFCRLIQSKSTNLNPNAKSMLFTIVRNLAIDQLRSNGRHPFEPFDASQIASRISNDDDARLATLEIEIQDSLRNMPVQWSDALQLKINGKLSYWEIAEVLDATHAQIRTWIHRARKQLEHDLIKKGLLGGLHDD